MNNIILKIKNRLRGIFNDENGYDIEYYPFGKTVRASKKEYLDLWYNAKNKVHPTIDEYEKLIGYKIEYDWFHELALHTQIVIKKSELCYQHGRVLYSTLSAYINQNDCNNINIVDIGTARGFSAIILSRALFDNNQHLGSITTIDPLPHRKRILWNCIDDNYGPHTREELLSGYGYLIDKYITFKEGRSIDVLPSIKNRIHFAFVDGEHNYENIIYETEHLSNHQKKGDIIVFDDYNKNQYPGLVEAVDQFCIKKSYSKKIIKGINARDYVVTSKR